MAGIGSQKAFGTPFHIISASLIVLFLSFILFSFLPRFQRWNLSWLKTFFIISIVFVLGMLLFVVKDVRFQPHWFGHQYSSGKIVSAVLIEAPVEKENSFKAEANVISIHTADSVYQARGRIIIYFKKDSSVKLLQAGSSIAFNKPLQEIRNNNNPGSFDYKQYSLYKGITHTIYLTEKNYLLSDKVDQSNFDHLLQSARSYVLSVLKKYIKGDKEQGLAEALLIGYKDDLDQSLLQSYTNTGVVHVIAVSGMHLALIFWLLNLVFRPLLKRKSTKWLHPVFILAILWAFTLLAGGAASIVRAAVMFSFILLGSAFNRKSSIYNTLAASAFALLCYNPYWLWDVGFLLSYAAVLSIVVFYKPVYNLLFVRNKLLDWLWQLAAVSIAAQILTTPIAIYYFHQFPVYFLVTNLLVVPVSSFVLIGELVLVLISFIDPLAKITGKILSALIWWMNGFIERLEVFPFSVWEGLQINFLQVIFLFIAIAAFSFWLMEKIKPALWGGLCAVTLFFVIRAISYYEAGRQRSIVVYNISKHDAVDFINRRNYFTITDSALNYNSRIVNMHLKPARTKYRITPVKKLSDFTITGNSITFFDKRILWFNSVIPDTVQAVTTKADLVILSGNPRLYISDLLKIVKPKQIVISGSSPAWKAAYWIKDCDSLHIPCHSVTLNGAFVMPIR